MSQATTSSSAVVGDGGNIELGATLLVSTSNNSSKYHRMWRRTLYIRFLISVKKSTTSSRDDAEFSYTSLPPSRTSSSKSAIAIDIEEEEEEEEEERKRERIRTDIAGIVKAKDSKSLEELGGVDFVASVLTGQRQHSEAKDGIIDEETVIPVSVLGANFFNFLLTSCKCQRCTILMLLISAGLSFAIEFKQEGPKHGWHDGVAIILAVFLLVAGNSLANFWRERKKLKLVKRIHELQFRVKRGEESLMVTISDILVGDTLCLHPGDKVPADGLLVSDGILELLEPEATKSKQGEGNPFLICGSKVIGGQGRMVVASVGSKANLAEIGTCCAEKSGLLESLIEKPISNIDIADLAISVLIALVVLIRLIFGKDGNNGGLPEMKGKVSISLLMEALERVFLRPQGRVSILTGIVTFAILCVQHGMPLAVTIALKYQIDKIVPDQDAVLNDLSACTTMGLITVICIDVSGGIILKAMEDSRIWMGEKYISKVEGSETDQPVLGMLKQGVGLSVLAPEFFLSPWSNSLVLWAEATWEMNMRSFTEEKFDMLKHRKLNSDKEGSGVLVRKIGDSEVLHLHWCGAASVILEMCSQYYDSNGDCHAMENQKVKFGQVIKDMEESGLETIAFAYRQTDGEELEQEDLILLGLIGLKFTRQDSIKSDLKNLRDAENVQIKLVSEDETMVVKEIAYELGLDGDVLEGKELQHLNEEARLDKVDLALVMGSFSPEDKLLMVQCLQKKGKVVAFIGTRLITSHTSVLKVADVGVVYDSLSTIVDRDGSDISIKCFSALKPIVMAGRSQYHNIQKFIQLHLTFTISGLAITLITAISTGDSPLTASQLIWVNVLMCILGCLMMVMKLTSAEQLAKQQSDHRNQSIITKEIWKKIVFQVLYQISVSMILEFGGHVTDREKKVRETMIFNTFLLCQLFNLLNTMQLLKKDVFFQSFSFLGVLVSCFVTQVLVIEYAKGLAGCMQLNATRWVICVLIGALSWVFEWALKNAVPVILSPRTNYASESITSPSFYLSTSFPLVMFLMFPVGITVTQIGMNMTFR